MEFRTLTTASELRQVFELEQAIWGYQSVEDAVPVIMLLVSVRIGGLVIGALEGERLVGFVYSLPGVRDGAPYQWSHMLGVAPEYRDAGLGWRLKVEQRRAVMLSGQDLIAWTFDPLQAANAHLNFAKLGTVAREYHMDAYPGSTSALHAGTPTDRLVVEWWIRSGRVKGRLSEVERSAGGVRAESDRTEAVPVNVLEESAEWPAPAGHDLGIDAPVLAVTIPTGFTEMQQRDLPLARAWRSATREIFRSYLARGYEVTDFLLDRPGRRGTYLLSRCAEP